MFNIIEGNNFNKVIQSPYPSGAGSIPYTFGWSNKYSPKPFGQKIYADNYSIYSNSNISNYGTNTLTFPRPFYGPVNSVYKVSLGGFAGGNCIDCSGINGDYLVYKYHGNFDANIFINRYNGIKNAGQIYWMTNICNKNKPVNFCGIDSILMTFGTDTVQSGDVKLNIYLNRLNALMMYSTSLPTPSASGNIVFSKNFGFISGVSNITKNLKPYMMEETHILTVLGSGNNNYTYPQVLDWTNPDTIVNPFTCDLTNATCTVSPYKNEFYDIKNTTLSFVSGELYPSNNTQTGYEIIQALPAGTHYRGGQIAGINEVSIFYSPRNFYQDYPNYKKLIFGGADTTEPSGYSYQFFPGLFKVNISGLPNIKFKSDCRNCNEYYIKDKNFILYDVNYNFLANRIQARYVWSTAASLDSDGQSFNYNNQYNICDHGCNNGVNIRTDDFTQGPCNNFMILTINESGRFDISSNPNIKLTADLIPGAVYNSGGNLRGDFSRYALTKTICDDNTSVKCTGSGIGTVGEYIKYGLIDFFNSGTWSGNWTKKVQDDWFYLQGNTNLTPPEFDIFNTCALESGYVFLTPYNSSPTPCADSQCNIVDNYKVAQNLSCTMTWLTDPSSYLYSSGYSTPQTLIAPLWDRLKCGWAYDSRLFNGSFYPGSSGNVFRTSFRTVSGGYLIFTLGALSIPSPLPGTYWSFPDSPYFSGLNINPNGVSVSSGPLNQNRTFTFGLYRDGVIPTLLATTSGTLSYEFIDLYDIRSYA